MDLKYGTVKNWTFVRYPFLNTIGLGVFFMCTILWGIIYVYSYISLDVNIHGVSNIKIALKFDNHRNTASSFLKHTIPNFTQHYVIVAPLEQVGINQVCNSTLTAFINDYINKLSFWLKYQYQMEAY